mmetsp:Transcript_43080/g.38318  ORF Transcript_43080/g.38318 Transcript_43080/m.38318 type:complete len:106 (+) Transcript_43080:82-399(+)
MTSENLIVFRQTDFPEEDENQSRVHLRVQQRRARKYWTTVQGLADDLDLLKILKYMKKMFNTNGNVVNDKMGDVIQLQGDQRKNIYRFLTEFNIVPKTQITEHGG